MKALYFFGLVTVLTACNTTDQKSIGTNANDSATLFATGTAEPTTEAAATTIEWVDSVNQDLGTITKGQVVEVSWKFKNTGTNPLTIQDVRAGCGCTTPNVPKEPIAPGAQSIITAKFNSEGFKGHVTKEVFVQANNSNRNNEVDNKLTFSADIKE